MPTTPDGVAANVKLCIATGVAGLSIEDATGREDDPLYPFELAVERIRAARRAIDETGSGVLLTARAECFLTGHPDPLNESARRIAAYAEAGADVLYAPGPKTPRADRDDRLGRRRQAGQPADLWRFRPDASPRSPRSACAASRSAAALARAAWAAFIEATRLIKEEGSFRGFAGNGPSAPLNPFFHDDLKARS